MGQMKEDGIIASRQDAQRVGRGSGNCGLLCTTNHHQKRSLLAAGIWFEGPKRGGRFGCQTLGWRDTHTHTHTHTHHHEPLKRRGREFSSAQSRWTNKPVTLVLSPRVRVYLYHSTPFFGKPHSPQTSTATGESKQQAGKPQMVGSLKRGEC